MAKIDIEIEKVGKPKGDYIEITPPPGLEIPQGLGEDEEFEMVTTWKAKPNGKICVVAIEGVEVPQKDDDEVEEEEEYEGPFPRREDEFMDGLAQAMAPANSGRV